ncbi:MAG: SpoIIE family protein phosphatase, partial [Acidobacteriota bacterium]
MAILRVEPARGHAFERRLETSHFTIGRGPANDLSFSDLWLSRLHARIEHRDGGHFLEDLGSRNGTLLNGELVAGATRLENGDLIRIGDVGLTYLSSAASLTVAGDRPLDRGGTLMLDSRELDYEHYRAALDSTDAHERNFLPALHGVAAALIRYQPVERLVELVLELILDAVPADRAALLLRHDDGELEIEAVHGFDTGSEVSISRTLVETVLGGKKAVITLDAQQDDRFDGAQSIMMAGIRALLAAPLFHDDDVIGLVYLDHRFRGRTFSEDDLRLVGLIANMAAVKIENARLLEAQLERQRLQEQLAVGTKIQRQLLPAASPVVAGYEIRAVNRTCYEVGGDSFDFVELPEGRLGLVISDISGKGVGAALLMAVLQTSIRTLSETVEEPARLMVHLNKVMVKSSPYNAFATVFYADFDPQRHQLTYVSAGHPPALVRHLDGTITELAATGPLVGMLRQASFEARTVDLLPGDLVVLYTDGVIEARGDGEGDWAVTGLAATLAELGAASAAEVVARLEHELEV